MPDTTGDLIVQVLIDWGIETVFGVPGEGIGGLIEALRRRRDRIRFVQTRLPGAAAMMASGHARLTGRLGVCVATSGPGGLQVLTGLYDAGLDGAPVLALTGLPPHDVLGTGVPQDIALDRVFADACVCNIRVMGPAHAEVATNLACRTALAVGGAAHLTIPLDIQSASIGRAARPSRDGMPPPPVPPRSVAVPDEAALARAAEVLNAGRRTCLLVGRGAQAARAEIAATADRLAAPVTESLLGKGVLPDESAFTVGGAGLLGTRASQEALEGCDTLLIVGSGFPYPEYYPRPGQARVVQIDSDARHVGRRVPADAALVGDAAATLRALLPLLPPRTDRGFLETAQMAMGEWRDELESQATRGDTPMKPQVVLRELDRLAPEDAIVVADCGTGTTWAARYMRIIGTRRFMTSGTLGTMGCALPYAIAATLAAPGRMAVAVVGDGALTMMLGELATCVRHRLDIKLLVLRNDTLAAVRWDQVVFAGTQEYACDLQPVEFAAAARAFGLTAFTIDRPEECGEVMEQAMATPGPVLIEAIVDPNEPPMPPKASLQQSAHMAEALARGTPVRRRMV